MVSISASGQMPFLTPSQAEEQSLHATALDKEHASTSATEPPRPKKKKGPKGPNPLSVKKKKVVPNIPQAKAVSQGDNEVARAGTKRKRVEGDDEEGIDSAPTDISARQKKRKRKRKHKSATRNEDNSTEATL